MHSLLTTYNSAGSRPAVRCCRLAAGVPAPLRPGLLLPSPATACHHQTKPNHPSDTQAPRTPYHAFTGNPQVLRAPAVGAAVRSGADRGPPSDHSHGGGRGRGRNGGSGHEGAREQGGGRGKGRGRGRDAAADAAGGTLAASPSRGGRGGGGSYKASGILRASDVEHLGQLQGEVERRAGAWVADENYGPLVTAFELACRLPPDPCSSQQEHAARRALLHTLAGVFLPLVSSITRPDYCTRPLWACAKTGYGWAGGADEVALAEALLGRLGEDGCALLRRAKSQEHASLWWSLSEAPNARLVAAQEQLLAASAECLVGTGAGNMDAQACANVLLACARLRHSPTHVPLVHHLTRCLGELPNPDAQHLSNALYALGELREDCGHVPHREDLRQLLSAVVRRLRGGRARDAAKGFIPQHLSNMLLGCAKLGVADGEAVQLLAAAAGAEAGRMEEQHLSNSVWALGKLLGVGDDVGGTTAPSRGAGGDGTAALAVTQLLSEVQRRLGQSRPTNATPKNRTAQHAFKCQELSNLLYGMALLQPYMDTATPAHGGMNGGPDGPMDTVAPVHAGVLNVRGPATTTFIASAEALAGECVRRSFRGFSPQELSNATWALAKMGHADQSWFAAAVAAGQRPAFTGPALPMEWAQLWYALARVRHRPPPGLTECTAGALEGQVRRGGPQECASLLWSFAVLGVWEERLAGVLLGRLAELVEQQQQGQGAQAQGAARGAGAVGQAAVVITEQDLANALWAVAVTGPGALAAHAREVGVLLREAARWWEQGGARRQAAGQIRGPFTFEELQQLWQVQLELEAMGGGDAGGPAALSTILPAAHSRGSGKGGGATAHGPGSMLAVMELAAQEERLGDAPMVSDLQKGVFAALRRLHGQQQQQQPRSPAAPTEGQAVGSGLAVSARMTPGATASMNIADVQHEALVPALHSRVDVLVPLSDGRVVAVEVNGPTHFLGDSTQKDGPTKLRDRQLARVFGQDNVVSVPYWEWNALHGHKAAEEQYVWGLLAGGEGEGRQQSDSRPTERGGTVAAAPGLGKASEDAAEATWAVSLQQVRRRRQQQQLQEQQQEAISATDAEHGPTDRCGGDTAPPPPEPPGRQATGGAEGRRRRRSVEEGAAGDAGKGGQPTQAPPDGAAPKVLAPRRRRQKLKVD